MAHTIRRARDEQRWQLKVKDVECVASIRCGPRPMAERAVVGPTMLL